MTAAIDFQLAEGDLVTTYKTYLATHKGMFMGIEPTERSVTFDVIDALKVKGDVITDHWGVMNIMSDGADKLSRQMLDGRGVFTRARQV